MSTNFQSCPKCDSFILSDTAQCPECGYVLDESRISSEAESGLETQKMYETCTECGESVRSGLVRCWSCNAFMRKDVAQRYEEMRATPQHIIFSDIPADQRTEFISNQGKSTGYGANVFDAVDDASELTVTTQEPEFELSSTIGQAAESMEAHAAPAPAADAAPQTEAPPAPPRADTPETAETAEAGDNADRTSDEAEADLVGLAMQDQRETRRRKRDRLAASRRKKVLLPCTACGSWMRVHHEQAGKVVRCGQCKARVVVPMLKKKEKPQETDTKTPAISVQWMDDVRLHIISPTDVVLKPGSMEKSSEVADVAIDESGLHLVQLAAPAKKSLFGKSGDGPPATDEQRQQIRKHIESTGVFADIPFGTLHSVPADQSSSIRLVQPVAEVHASMFAGVPVFGEGQIAIHLPLKMPEEKQAFLSFPLFPWRQFSEQLNKRLDVEIGAADNGVPATEVQESETCEISSDSFQVLANVVYYETDPDCELEIAGYKCVQCGIAVSEEGRARKKLGGAKGKGIAKAKCPKCNSKMGDMKLWKLVSKPEPAEEEEAAHGENQEAQLSVSTAASEETGPGE